MDIIHTTFVCQNLFSTSCFLHKNVDNYVGFFNFSLSLSSDVSDGDLSLKQ